jgi:hypothetical protein
MTNHSNSSTGIFSISLDFELYWGMRDCVKIEHYKDNLSGVSNAIEVILKLFTMYEIHATWAPVGFLFFPDITTLKENFPKKLPSYRDTQLDPYSYIENNLTLEHHFMPHIIKKISTCKNQEIGTHTFSHYYCLEEGQTVAQFEADLSASINITKKELNRDVKSLVFPRNQYHKEYLEVLLKLGISSFRGNQEQWIYKTSNEKENGYLKRALKLLDSYINITGEHTYDLNEIPLSKPYNIKSSQFLRPVSSSLSFLEKLRLRRILKAMTHAALKKQVYHLWWHPHNFGVNLHANSIFLEAILKHYHSLQKHYNMQSLNMQEIASRLEKEY